MHMADGEQNLENGAEDLGILNAGTDSLNEGDGETNDAGVGAETDSLNGEGSETNDAGVNAGADSSTGEGAKDEDMGNDAADAADSGSSDSRDSSDENEQKYFVPDQGFNFFLIHLDGSTSRYDTVVPRLDAQGIDYKIVGVNGTQVQFWHNASNTYFSGEELVASETTAFSNGNHQLNKFQKYNITCDPDSSEPTKFPYNGFDINAGQIGQLCSHIKCWQEGERGLYKHTVIMTDNALPAYELKENLAYIAGSAPADYDYIFLRVNQTDGGRISYDSFLDKFTPDARFNNVLGVMISQHGLNKLLSDYDIPFNTDVGVYYYEAATCYKGNWNIFCNFAPGFDTVNAYVSTIPLLGLYDSESVMGTMGPVKDVLGIMKIGDV